MSKLDEIQEWIQKLQRRAEIIKAYERGENVQRKSRHGQHLWSLLPGDNIWDFNSFEYRLEPENEVIYVNIYPSGELGVNRDKTACEENASWSAKEIAVKYIRAAE